jgi:hypothetical protein
MVRKKKQAPEIRELEPDELNEYKKLAIEYVDRLAVIENEITTLKGDKKTLDEEFEEKIDLKTLKKVIQTLNIEAKITAKDTFEIIKEALKDSS